MVLLGMDNFMTQGESVAQVFFFQAEDGIRDYKVTGVQTCALPIDRKSTRLNSSHLVISYAVFCLKKKKTKIISLYNGRTFAPATGTKPVMETSSAGLVARHSSAAVSGEIDSSL